MNNVYVFIAFVTGVVVGSIVTKQYLDWKNPEYLDIDAGDSGVDDTQPISKSEVPTPIREQKPDLSEYAAMVKEKGYINYSAQKPVSSDKNIDNVNGDEIYPEDDRKEVSEVIKNEKPYVIPPEEFGENDDYKTISLVYYSDRFLTDEDDVLVEDVESTVGFDSLDHFGEYEDDSVFVRNDRLQCDYEILLDQRNYSDVINKRPHPIEED